MRTAFSTREPRYATTGRKTQTQMNATVALAAATTRGGQSDALAGRVSVVMNTMAARTPPMIASRFVTLRTASAQHTDAVESDGQPRGGPRRWHPEDDGAGAGRDAR